MSTLRARACIATATGLLLLAGLCWAAPPRSGPAPAAHERGDATQVAAGQRRDLPRAVDLDPHAVATRRVYSARFTTKLGEGDAGHGSFFATSGKVDLDLTVLRNEAGRLVLEAKVRSAEVNVGNQEQAAQRHGETEKALQAPFYLDVDGEGRIERIRQTDGLEPLAHSLQRFLGAQLQFVRPDAARDELAWTATESDSSGVYEARYRKLAEGRYEKRKSEYREHALAQNGSAPTVDGKAQYAIRADGLVAEVDAQEQMSVALGDARIHADSNVQIELVRLERGQAHDIDGAGLASRSLYEPPTAVTEPSDDELRRLVAGADLPALLEALAREAPGKGEQARWRTQERIVALLRLDPASAQALRGRIAGLSPEDAAMAMGALADAQTPESQQALLDLARDRRVKDELAHTALGHLTVGDKPSPATITGLQELAAAPETSPELRKSALLALGASAGHGAAQPDTAELAGRTIDGIVEQLAGPIDESERILLVSSLGNSGSSRALPALTAALADPSAAVRSSAVTSLRTIEGAESLIGDTLLNDADSYVRADAALAAKFRPLNDTLQQALAKAIREDQDARVRSNAVEVAGERLDEASEAVREALSHAKDHDQVENIREQAERYLDGSYKNPEGGPGNGEPEPGTAPAADDQASGRRGADASIPASE